MFHLLNGQTSSARESRNAPTQRLVAGPRRTLMPTKRRKPTTTTVEILPAFGLGQSGAVRGQPAAAPTQAPKQGSAHDAQGLIMKSETCRTWDTGENKVQRNSTKTSRTVKATRRAMTGGRQHAETLKESVRSALVTLSQRPDHQIKVPPATR